MPNDLASNLARATHLLASSQVEEALALYRDLFVRYPNELSVLLGLAKALCAKGDTHQALTFIQEYSKNQSQPSTSAELYFLKGFALESKADWHEAIKCYETCIYFDPSHFNALYNQGNIFLELGRYNEALVRYNLAAQLDTKHPQLLSNAGIACVNLGDLEAAVSYFDMAIQVAPHFVQGVANKAGTLLEMGRAQDALDQFTHLLSLGREQNLLTTTLHAHRGRGLALVELHRNKEALESFSEALELDPHNPELLNNRGNVYKYLGHWDKATADFEQALVYKADYAQAHSNLGNVYQESGLFDEALREYQRAIQLEPSFAQAHLNKALLMLGEGQFESGFQEYEWRWATPEYARQVLHTSQPLWEPSLLGAESPATPSIHPSSSKSLRLLVWNEQGVGDDIYFARFLPLIRLLSSFVQKVIVRIDARLIPIFSYSFPNIEFISDVTQLTDQDFDAHIPIASLAKFSKFPGAVKTAAYLRCEPGRVTELRHSLIAELLERDLHSSQSEGTPFTDFVIGVSWKSLNPKSGAKRSLALSELMEQVHRGINSLLEADPSARNALRTKRIRWVSLQYSDIAEEIKLAEDHCAVRVHSIQSLDAEHDLERLSQLISGCDLVISIDNTTAHMAGALGVKTWVVLPFTSDWRWQVVQDPVYGYASAKIFRQTVPSEWAAPLGQVGADLCQLLMG